ncbi:olfactory receptor [Cricetulus griseus]|nr:olfactory receptor [Cricetulus griseus]
MPCYFTHDGETGQGGLEVKTAEETQIVFLHANVTVPCEIPGSPHLDIKTVGIIWSFKNVWNESEVPIYELYGNHLKVLRPGANVSLLGLERGDASLHLPRIKLSEAGEYRCKLVVTPEHAEGMTRVDVVGKDNLPKSYRKSRHSDRSKMVSQNCFDFHFFDV